MIIGKFLYENFESIASSPAIARRRLGAWTGGLLVGSGAFITLAELSHSESITVRDSIVAGLAALGSTLFFDGYRFGHNLSNEQPTIELPVLVVVETQTALVGAEISDV